MEWIPVIVVGLIASAVGALSKPQISSKIAQNINGFLVTFEGSRASAQVEPLTADVIREVVKSSIEEAEKASRLSNWLHNLFWFALGCIVSVVSPLLTRALFGV